MSVTPIRGFIPQVDPTPLFEEKLASSGLDTTDAELLGYTALTTEEVAKLKHWYWHPVPALRIPYFDPYTGAPMKFRTNWPDFYRVRWLSEPPPAPPLAGQKPKKPPRYLQAKDTGMCAYYPRIGGIIWAEVLTDYNQPIIITEGELKAAAGCKAGIPTIGLGGVDNFVSTANGYDFVPSLENVVWARRIVTICYDSDVAIKPGVCAALQRLADQLMDRGALPKFVVLPQIGDAKVGLDDYLLDHTVEQLKSILNEQGQFITMARSLFDINDQWSFVNKFVGLVRHADGDTIRQVDFTSLFTANVERRELKKNGEIESTMVPAGERWLKWPMRSTVDDVTYDPSRPPLARFDDELKDKSYFNTWVGWGTKKNFSPIKADVAPFLELMKYLFTGSSEEAMRWMIQWCGYPIKHPGTKLRTSAIIHGPGERIGKSSIGYTLKEIYGQNFQEIHQNQLMGSFNTWQVRRQFIMCDDITGDNKYSTIDFIKAMISGQDIYVNEKNKPNYNLPDKANYLWTSNRPATFALGDEDSRFFVHKVEVVSPWPPEKWDRYYDWLRLEGGAEALFHYFVHEVDYAGFYPNGSALSTDAKEDMKEASQSTLGIFIRDILRYGPEEMFLLQGTLGPNVQGRDLFTIEEIKMFFEGKYQDEKPSHKIISNVLQDAKCERAHKSIIITDTGRGRYWILRNADKWKTATYEEKQAHINNPAGDKKPAPPEKKSEKVVTLKPKGKKY